MKKLFIVIAIAIVSLLVSRTVLATEGTLDLSGNGAICKLTSVWRESDYRVIGRCEGLVYPYQTQFEHYVVWARGVDRDVDIRIGEIDRGYFEGNVSDVFDKIKITAEETGTPRRPSDKVVMEGDVVPFEFDESEMEATRVEAEQAEEVDATVETAPGVDGEGSTIGRVIGRIVTAILTIILVVIGLVIVSSLIFRRRGSVSK